jgi:hypothetical protein
VSIRKSRLVSIVAVALALAGPTGPAVAQDSKDLEKPPKLEPLPDVPPPPQGGSNIQNSSEPVVSTRQEGDNKIEEYRVHGKLYAIRVTPKVGPPYTMVDPDGKGSFITLPDHADDAAGQKVHPPRWVLFEF